MSKKLLADFNQFKLHVNHTKLVLGGEDCEDPKVNSHNICCVNGVTSGFTDWDDDVVQEVKDDNGSGQC